MNYAEFIRDNMPRVLTQVDRDADSRTYGSCDRNYWHLKIRDFSSAILQQTCLTLALAYKYNFEGNIYYKNKKMREWAIAALRYITKIQLKDGSFNEYYPNEHGYPPTAFVLFSGCLTYKELRLEEPDILEALHRAAVWLSVHDEKKACNQELASIAGLYLYHTIAYDSRIYQRMKGKIERVLAGQSSEGWFMEQGGADIGYLSVGLDMLSEYYVLSQDECVVNSICAVMKFLQYFIHQDGTIGGEYASRNTIYFMPAGIENVIGMNIDVSKIAEAVKRKVYNDWDKREHFMNAVDERYLTHYVMHSFLRAVIREGRNGRIAGKGYLLPCYRIHHKVFREAGLVSVGNGNQHIIIAAQKGGVIKTFSYGREICTDCGYRSRMKGGVIAVTNWQDSNWQIRYGKNKIDIRGKFSTAAQKVQCPVYHLGIRLAALLLGGRVNKIIKKLTIFSNNHTEIYFWRRIVLRDDEIVLQDRITLPGRADVYTAENHSVRLVASGRFFSMSDLKAGDVLMYEVNRKIRIEKRYHFCGTRSVRVRQE